MSGGSLPVRRVEKVWGREVLPAPFVDPVGARIGEIWFEPPADLPQLLVKYIFTNEKLSVQVHPSDRDAPGKGKEECWLILDAQPGATLGIGFRQETPPDAIRAAAIDGSIEELMAWHTVRPGDFYYIPAGTVHAIGAGISLIEVQQNSDVTYRLYDYGRPRALHLDQAVAVANGAPYPVRLRGFLPARASRSLVDGPLFRLDQVEGVPDPGLTARYRGGLLIIPREGPVHIAGQEVAPGGCGFARDLAEVEFSSSGVSLLAQPCSA